MKPNLRYSFNRSDRSKHQYHISFESEKGRSTKDQSVVEQTFHRPSSPMVSPARALQPLPNANSTLTQYYQSRCDRMKVVVDKYRAKEIECQKMERQMFILKIQGERLMARFKYLQTKRATTHLQPPKSQAKLRLQAQMRTINDKIQTVEKDTERDKVRQVDKLAKDQQDIQTYIRMLAGAETKMNSCRNSPLITPFSSSTSTPKNSTTNLHAVPYFSSKTNPKILLALRKKIHQKMQELREKQFENDKLKLQFTRMEMSKGSLHNSRLSERNKANRMEVNLQKPELLTLRLKSLQMRVQSERKRYEREWQSRITEIESSADTLLNSYTLRTSNSSLELMRGRANQVRGQLAQLQFEHQMLKNSSEQAQLEKCNQTYKRQYQLLAYECKVIETDLIRIKNEVSVLSAENDMEEKSKEKNAKIVREIENITIQIEMYKTQNERLSVSPEKPRRPSGDAEIEETSQQSEIVNKLKDYEYLRELQAKSDQAKLKLQINQQKESISNILKQNRDITDTIQRRKRALEGGSFDPIMERTEESLATELSQRKDTIEDLINDQILNNRGGRTKCVVTVAFMVFQILVILYLIAFQGRK